MLKSVRKNASGSRGVELHTSNILVCVIFSGKQSEVGGYVLYFCALYFHIFAEGASASTWSSAWNTMIRFHRLQRWIFTVAIKVHKKNKNTQTKFLVSISSNYVLRIFSIFFLYFRSFYIFFYKINIWLDTYIYIFCITFLIREHLCESGAAELIWIYTYIQQALPARLTNQGRVLKWRKLGNIKGGSQEGCSPLPRLNWRGTAALRSSPLEHAVRIPPYHLHTTESACSNKFSDFLKMSFCNPTVLF